MVKKKRRPRLWRYLETGEVRTPVTEKHGEVPEFSIAVYPLSAPKGSEKPMVKRRDLQISYSLKTFRTVSVVPVKPSLVPIKKGSQPVKSKVVVPRTPVQLEPLAKTIVVKRLGVLEGQAPRIRAKVLSTHIPDEFKDVLREAEVSKPVTPTHEEKAVAIGAEEPSHGRPVSIEELFPLDSILVGLDGLVKLSSSRPKVVIAYKPKSDENSYIDLLVMVLRDLYRVYRGGLPTARFIRSRREFEELWPLLKASDSIVAIDYDAIYRDSQGDDELKEILVDRVRELISQNLGYVVLYTSKEVTGSKDRKSREILAEIRRVYGDGNPDVIEIELREGLDRREYLKAIASYVGLTGYEEILPVLPINSFARFAEAKYYECLESILQDPMVLSLLEPSPVQEGAEESDHHLLLKAAVIKQLLKRWDPKDILCEQKLGDAIVDLCLRKGGRCSTVIEVETLYGTHVPMLKLKNVIRTRCKEDIDELWIVIPKYAFALLGKALAKFIDSYVKVLKTYTDLNCRIIRLATVEVVLDKGAAKPRLVTVKVFPRSRYH